ncbi:hypothetical protein J1N35_043091, partial [Gossypium stocksii]
EEEVRKRIYVVCDLGTPYTRFCAFIPPKMAYELIRFTWFLRLLRFRVYNWCYKAFVGIQRSYIITKIVMETSLNGRETNSSGDTVAFNRFPARPDPYRYL